MAADAVAVMRTLGHQAFAVVGHDRGGRVAHRLALDHSPSVARIAVFDIAPIAKIYARTDKAFATRYFWWFFLIQPEPLPERLIAADPEFFLRTNLDGQSKTPGSPSRELFAEYLRVYRDPATRHAICEECRAAATIDLDHDAADADRRIEAPLLALQEPSLTRLAAARCATPTNSAGRPLTAHRIPEGSALGSDAYVERPDRQGVSGNLNQSRRCSHMSGLWMRACDRWP